MECSGQVKFKDDEYKMEEALQNTRYQLIAMLEEDEHLQCLRGSRCSCPFSFQQLQAYHFHHYQLFEYDHRQVFHAPPPAIQVSKPSIRDDHLAQTRMKIEAQDLDQSWEMAKASTDLIPVAKVARESAKTAFRNKIYGWFDAPKCAAKKVQAPVKENINLSIEFTPVWPPMKRSPWYQMSEKPKTTMKDLSCSVAAFIQKFAALKPATKKPEQTTFWPVMSPIKAARINIVYTGLPFTGISMSASAIQLNYAM